VAAFLCGVCRADDRRCCAGILQKRNLKTNLTIIIFPILVYVLHVQL
jgi:hypothetical protein